MVHWLEIGGINKTKEEELEQWNNLNEYLRKYNDASYEIYCKNTGDIYKRVVKLKCKQDYNSLDLDCNSLFNDSIKRLSNKPTGIERISKDIYFFLSA